jgi:molecular chaperone DnaK
MDLYIEVNQDKMREILGPVFQGAINVSKDLLKRNNLLGSDLSSLLLVGGPTYSPVLRTMLTDQICKPDTSVDPMTAVAKGAAVYASTISISEENIVRDKLKVQLDLGYESTSVEENEMVTIKIDSSKTESEIPETLFVELENVDGTWSSGKSKIGPKGELVTASLNAGKSNIFKVLITDQKGDPVECQPSEISILQGTKVGSAVLPYHMGIEIFSRSSEMMIFSPSKGLEKNKPIPATGINNGLKTTKILRPGVKDDVMKVAIYQGEHDTEGTRAIYNHHVSDIIITGLDVENTIPEGSEVEITIKIDQSEQLQFSAFFPSVSETFELQVPILRTESIPESRIEDKLDEAIYDAKKLEQSSDAAASSKAKKVKESLNTIKERWNGNRSDDDRKHETMENVKKEMRAIDELKDNTSWESIESELRSELARLEQAQSEVGGIETKHIVTEVRSQVDQVIREQNIRMAKALISDIGSLHFDITRIYQYIGFLRFFDNDFDSIAWRGDKSSARSLVTEGMRAINGNPTLNALQPIISQIIQNHYPKQSLPGAPTGQLSD